MTSTKKAGYTMSELSNLPHREVMGDECAIDGCPYESDGRSRYCAEHKPIAKKAGYTPGPWKLFSPLSMSVVATRGGSGETIATAFALRVPREGFDYIEEAEDAAIAEAFANAKLIAQSPRMVEALAAFVHWYEVDSTEFNRDTAFEMAKAVLRDAGVIE